MRAIGRVGALATTLLLVATMAGAGELCGDADGSGAITVTDGVQTLRAAAALTTSCTAARCDLDASGAVTVTDGVKVLRVAAGLPVLLACPGPTPTCESTTVTVALTVPEPIGAASMTLAYPTSLVSLPGSGDAAAERVTVLDAGRGLLGGGQPNDRDDRVLFSLVASEGLDSGDLLTVRFDCLGAAPDARQFACTLTDVTAPDGLTPVEGASCAVAVVSE